MNPIIFDFPCTSALGDNLRQIMGAGQGVVIMRNFPDGEAYLRVETNVAGHDVIVNASLYQPDNWFLSLLFLADALAKQGARRVILLAPYLSYMRQDKAFQPGEAVTSITFAKLISQHFDGLITVDPHLHRYKSLDEIYTIPTTVVQSASLLRFWIQTNVSNPFIIGPDEESAQWVQEIAGDLPCVILQKVRRGDNQVHIIWPEIKDMVGKNPVLVDDIISSGGTMVSAIQYLKAHGFSFPYCLAIHPIFAQNSFEKIRDLGVADVVTCNSIPHTSNQIDLAPMLAKNLFI